VPEYAGGLHERMDGKRYPRGLTRERMSVQDCIMGIADTFGMKISKRSGSTYPPSLSRLRI
jgi:HD-GYP domain-containing protein (c-di-GMP phosphodiesterase class II)